MVDIMTPGENKLSADYVTAEFELIFREPGIDRIRFMLETVWMRNILYYMGEQWLSWLESRLAFTRRYEFNTSVPTPVSNFIRDYVRSMKALTLGKRFVTRVWPESEELEDKDAAELAEFLLRHIDARDDYALEDVKEMTELWRILTGNGFTRTFGDSDSGVYIHTEDGAFSKGEVRTIALSPLQVLVPQLGTCLKEKSYVAIKTLKSKEWVEDTYEILLKTPGDSKSMLSYERQLLTLIANVSPWKGRGFEQEIEEDLTEKMVVVKEVEFRPTKEFPEGRYAVVVDGQFIKATPGLPIPTDPDTGEWNYTVDHYPYNYTPGGFWASGGVEDLISPQNTVNEVDQALATNRRSLGRPHVLTPSELNIRRRSHKGQSLLELRYDARTSMGSRGPQIFPGTPYPNQILDERAQQREVAQEAAGDPKNILRGQSPHSGASGVMVDILREAAEQSHSPDINRFYRNWQRMRRKQLVVAQALYTENRMLKVKGKGNRILVRAFTGADLRKNTDVRLEPDNALATTQAGKNELLIRLIQGNLFGDITQKPELQRDLVRRLGLGSVPEEFDIHVKKAEYENSVLCHGDMGTIKKPGREMKNIAFPDPFVTDENGEIVMDETNQPVQVFPETRDKSFRIDNHVIHLQIIEDLILSAQFRELPDERQRYILGHRDLHEQAYQMEVQQQMAQMAIQQALSGITNQELGGGGGVMPPAGPPGGPVMGGGGAPPAAEGGIL